MPSALFAGLAMMQHLLWRGPAERDHSGLFQCREKPGALVLVAVVPSLHQLAIAIR